MCSSNRLRLITKLRQGLVQKDKVHIDSEAGAQISSLANKMETMVMQYYH